MWRYSIISVLFLFITGCSLLGLNDPLDARIQLQTTTQISQTQTQVMPDIVFTPTITAPAFSPTLSPAPTLAPPTNAPPTAILPTNTPLSHIRFPDVSAYSWREIAGNLNAPVMVTHAGDGSGRLFIVEQGGRIRIWAKDYLNPTPYLDISDRVGYQGSEQGLLGLAFHPRYKENGYLFVNYTDLNGDSVIARFSVSTDDPGLALPGSEIQLLSVSQPYANHNGGMVAFGPDGYLYLGLGDGGSSGDPHGNAQSLTTLLGKILRLDVDRGEPYAIPEDNPFATGGGMPEIWVYGLRNPWRFTFDQLSGDLYLGDVGQNQWEEIDFLAAGTPGGANLGWNYFEGNHQFSGTLSQDLSLVAPVAEYSHGLGCSVTGGVVYRGSQLSEMQGLYLYGDYCTGRIWGLIRDAQGHWLKSQLFDGMGRISSFGEDEDGEIYLVDHIGRILQLVELDGPE